MSDAIDRETTPTMWLAALGVLAGLLGIGVLIGLLISYGWTRALATLLVGVLGYLAGRSSMRSQNPFTPAAGQEDQA